MTLFQLIEECDDGECGFLLTVVVLVLIDLLLLSLLRSAIIVLAVRVLS